MSKIEWTNETWNIITGCNKISEGCQNCYAEKMHKRLTAMGQVKYYFPFCNVIFHYSELSRKITGKNKMVFVNSMSDTFNEKISAEQITKILAACKGQYQHTFQILTKRAERITDFTYPDNVWLGVTVENAKYKNRIDYLKQTNAKIKFLSCEPLLEDLGELDLKGIDWVIVGGESGKDARPMHPDWVRNIQRQCKEQNVGFFFKQWGEWMPAGECDYDLIKDKFFIRKIGKSEVLLNVEINEEFSAYKVGKKYAGCLLNGREYKEYPQKRSNG